VSPTDENGVSLGEISEAEILARVFPRLPSSASELLGPGDDAAVISAPDGCYVVTTDMMVEGPDFRLDWSTPFEIGFKAAAINLADVAAMGARPTALVVALGAPSSTPVTVLERIADGLRAACEQLAPGCGVVGGDLSSAPALVLSIAAHGDLAGHAPITRSGAQPGDVVAIAGELGLAGLGLDLFFEYGSAAREIAPAAVTAQCAPRPPIELGPAAATAGAHAAMDVSDGLALDASRLARASSVRIDLSREALSGRVEALRLALGTAVKTDSELFDYVLYSGESHAILATFAPDAVPAGFSVIGSATQPGAGAVVTLDGEVIDPRGWHPFQVG
jgi:thiamine-monophosphate kinase